MLADFLVGGLTNAAVVCGSPTSSLVGSIDPWGHVAVPFPAVAIRIEVYPFPTVAGGNVAVRDQDFNTVASLTFTGAQSLTLNDIEVPAGTVLYYYVNEAVGLSEVSINLVLRSL